MGIFDNDRCVGGALQRTRSVCIRALCNRAVFLKYLEAHESFLVDLGGDLKFYSHISVFVGLVFLITCGFLGQIRDVVNDLNFSLFIVGRYNLRCLQDMAVIVLVWLKD